ncbi:MAG: DUF5615 family PIN-like protein [Armatimonadetes bacterium]|nr:DUF5615 family PIN-like protein [Armatimonadota bacterium]
MRFLLDMGISPKVAGTLGSLGHEAVRCSEIGLSGASDLEILGYAESHGLILVSTDLDFADLTFACKEPCPGLVLLRLDNPSSEMMCSRLQIMLTALAEDEIAGSVVIIQHNKVRTRKL